MTTDSPRPPKGPEDFPSPSGSPVGAGSYARRGVRCTHPPENRTTDSDVTLCRCGARMFPDYRALGGAALGVADRRPEPPTGPTSTATGTFTISEGTPLRLPPQLLV